MLNERLSAAKPIAKSIKDVETSLNDALRNMGTLLVDVANARSAKGTRFALDAGLSACEKIAGATTSAVQSFHLMIEAHEHLATDRENAGLPAVGWGDNSCRVSGSDSASSLLRVVGDDG
jgi:hypothetical protein